MNHENEEKLPVFQAVEAEVETDESRPSQPVKLPNPPISAATDSQGKDTVIPHIVAAATILFWKFECGNYSREETIQRRKVLFYCNF